MSKFQVSKAVIVEAATKAICEVEVRRTKAVNELIDSLMNRWFFPCKTREEAIKEFKDTDKSLSALMECNCAKTAGWQTMGTAKDLINACSVTQGDIVTLDGDDAVFVGYWMKK